MISIGQCILKCSGCTAKYQKYPDGWQYISTLYEEMLDRENEYAKQRKREMQTVKNTISGQGLWLMARHDGYKVSIKEIHRFAEKYHGADIVRYNNTGYQFPMTFYKNCLMPWLKGTSGAKSNKRNHK